MFIHKLKVFFIISTLIFSRCFCTYPQEAKDLYLQGIDAARLNNLDSAFMYFHAFLSSRPKSDLVELALFATGEYYFLIRNYQDAFSTFMKIIKEYPHSKTKPFVLMYLLEVTKIYGHEELINDIKKEIVIFRQVGLVFSDFKEYSYVSPLFRKHKAVYFIDKAEFYIDSELFTKITY